MNNFDSNGWDSIHSAAYKGFISSLEKLIEKYPEKLELTTLDELRSTPLLLAVMSGNLDTVKELIKLGAQLHTRNSQGHGIIEILCLRKDVEMLTYFLDNVDEEILPAWVHLSNFISSDNDEESIRASFCVHKILNSNNLNETKKPYDELCVAADIVPAIVKVLKGLYGFDCKLGSLFVLQQLIIYQEVREKFINKGGLETLLPLLRISSNPDAAKVTIQILDVLATEPEGFSEKVFNSGAFADMNKIMELFANFVEEKFQKYESYSEMKNENVDEELESTRQLQSTWHNADLLKEVVQLIGNIAEINPLYQSSIGKEKGCLTNLGIAFKENENRTLMIELIKCVSKLSKDNIANQKVFMKENIEEPLINLCRAKDLTIQLAAVDAIISLAKGNVDYQNRLMSKVAYKPLLLMLRKSGRNVTINEKSSSALWVLAGETRDSKANMANLIGVDLLIDFLKPSSNILQLIGSEAIFVLSGGPKSQRDIIGKKNGIQPIVNLLNSNNKEIVMSCIRSLRELCVKLGYVPHVSNQQLVIINRGLQLLVDIMKSDDDEVVQMEAAYTIAMVSMRNEEAFTELHCNPKFTYVYILEKMYSSLSKVQLLACASLAAFAHNNLSEQKKIAMYGGIRFRCFQPFLLAELELERCMSAFQLIALARVIPDQTLSLSIAFGIKTIMQTLVETKNSDVQELGCDCIARLCHSKAGIASAMISLGVVDILTTLMISYIDSVKGTAAIAVKYLLYYPEARRQILRKCRRDPYLMKVILFFNKESDIDQDFIEGWKHFKNVGLPKITIGRPSLIMKKEIDLYKDLNDKQLTLFSNSGETNKSGFFSERKIIMKFPKIENKFNTLQENVYGNNTSRSITSERIVEEDCENDILQEI